MIESSLDGSEHPPSIIGIDAATAGEDPRGLAEFRFEGDVLNGEKVPLVRHLVFVKEPPHEFDPFEIAGGSLLDRNVERLELGVDVPGAHPECELTAGEVLQRDRPLCGHHGVSKRKQHDARPDRDRLGLAGGDRKRRQRIEQRRGIGRRLEEVFDEPRPGKPVLVRESGVAPKPVRRDGVRFAAERRKTDAELHTRTHRNPPIYIDRFM